MANRIKFNSAAFRAILTGGGVRGLVSETARSISGRAPGTRAQTIIGGFGGGRAVGFVSTQARSATELNQQREALEAASHGA